MKFIYKTADDKRESNAENEFVINSHCSHPFGRTENESNNSFSRATNGTEPKNSSLKSRFINLKLPLTTSSGLDSDLTMEEVLMS